MGPKDAVTGPARKRATLLQHYGKRQPLILEWRFKVKRQSGSPLYTPLPPKVLEFLCP